MAFNSFSSLDWGDDFAVIQFHDFRFDLKWLHDDPLGHSSERRSIGSMERSSRLSGKTEQNRLLSPYGELAVIKIALPKAAKEETTYGTQNHGSRNSQTARLGTTGANALLPFGYAEDL